MPSSYNSHWVIQSLAEHLQWLPPSLSQIQNPYPVLRLLNSERSHRTSLRPDSALNPGRRPSRYSANTPMNRCLRAFALAGSIPSLTDQCPGPARPPGVNRLHAPGHLCLFHSPHGMLLPNIVLKMCPFPPCARWNTRSTRASTVLSPLSGHAQVQLDD